ncbi:MAG TPA: DUF494 family protein [Gemmatimonadaceae bacterium]|nr:MAG: hypothetical protein ABS52_13515 [Gemmatimonadetes bacterium SCN 70-22]HMN09610.1 DUF494 family protein [Gemmatimonadaceae bacterium]
MDHRLAHALSQLRERFPSDAEVGEVVEYLSSEGYNRREIGEIVSAWVSEIPPVTDARTGAGEGSVPIRVMGPHERGRFTPEAWGYLLSLSASGALSAGELETVIDRALSQVDGRIALDDIRTLMDVGGSDDSGTAPDQVTIH